MSHSVDLVFPLAGQSLRSDYALPLWQALRAALPWLADESDAAILPIKGSSPSAGQLLLNRRAQLTLRLPPTRVAAAKALAGMRLDLGGALQLGEAQVRELRPTAAQYSPLVVFEADDEVQFLAHCERALDSMAVRANLVCGRTQTVGAENGELRGFSLMAHGLALEHALRLQQFGLGRARKLGCGIFVPHKTAHAVGAA